MREGIKGKRGGRSKKGKSERSVMKEERMKGKDESRRGQATKRERGGRNTKTRRGRRKDNGDSQSKRKK